MTLVVPFSAGSAQDIFARLISEPLSQKLNSRVNVLNKPGAGGTIAAAYVAQAKPDGLTYLVAASGHHLAGVLYPRLHYDPVGSFNGAIFFGHSDFVLISASELGTSDLPAFVNLIKKNSRVFNYASAGNGSTTHVGMALFLQRAGLEMVHLPLKGSSEVINEVLSGRAHAAMVSALSIQAYKNDSRIKIMGVTSPDRSANFMDLPTVAESGFPQFQWSAWTGLLAPAGTPTNKIEEIREAFRKVTSEPEIKLRFQQLGIPFKTMSVAQFDIFLREEWRQATVLIPQLKIKPD